VNLALCSSNTYHFEEDKLIKKIITFTITLLFATSCFGAEPFTEWVKDKQDIKWNATPLDFPDKISSKDSIMWFGTIEDMKAYTNDVGETVIEFFCRHLSPINRDASVLKENLIQVKDLNTGFFVITVRSRDLPLEKASGLCEELKTARHFAAVQGEPEIKRVFSDKLAVFVHSVKSAMSPDLPFKIVK